MKFFKEKVCLYHHHYLDDVYNEVKNSEIVMKKYMAYVIESGLPSSFTNLHNKNPCKMHYKKFWGSPWKSFVKYLIMLYIYIDIIYSMITCLKDC